MVNTIRREHFRSHLKQKRNSLVTTFVQLLSSCSNTTFKFSFVPSLFVFSSSHACWTSLIPNKNDSLYVMTTVCDNEIKMTDHQQTHASSPVSNLVVNEGKENEMTQSLSRSQVNSFTKAAIWPLCWIRSS